jgi:ribosomal protein S18 acetylase RimI-like enzyme
VPSPVGGRPRIGYGVVMSVRFGPEDVGRRVTVRVRALDDPERTIDTVGTLRAWSSTEALIERRDGEVVTIAPKRMLAGRVVAPEVSAIELQRRCAADWLTDEQQPLGPWTLRRHDGVDRDRTTSALALDHPGDQARTRELLDEVHAFYVARGLPPQVLSIAGSEVDAAIAAQGWSTVQDIDVLVARVDLEGAGDPRPASGAAPEVTLSPTPPERMLRVQARGTDPEPLRRLLATGPPAQHAIATLPTGEVVGSVRVTRADRWAGVTFLEVDAAHRRRGIGTALLTAALDAAGIGGAHQAWLQVEAGNDAARSLYAAAGFVPHHRYRYRRPM